MNRNDVVGLLSPHIRFKNEEQDSDNLPAFCPFHKGGQEKTPGLYVYVGPTKGRHVTGHAFCHTCQEGWSLRGLLAKLGVKNTKHINQLLEFQEDEGPKKKKLIELDFTLPVIPEAVLGLFDFAPLALIKEGFDRKTLRAFEIGFDRRRKKITFPIRSHLGPLAGISGRDVLGIGPRYKIYTDELEEAVPGYEFKKGRVLWGLHRFYDDAVQCRLTQPVVVCEGFKAAMWVFQNGYENVVALIGASATREQRHLLSLVGNDVVIFLDNDNAGRDATLKLLDRIDPTYVRVVDYGTEKPVSPDDLDRETIENIVSGAMHPLLWRLKNGKR